MIIYYTDWPTAVNTMSTLCQYINVFSKRPKTQHHLPHTTNTLYLLLAAKQKGEPSI